MHRSGIFGGIVAPAQPQLIMIMLSKQPHSWLLYHQCKNQIYIYIIWWHTTYSTVHGYNYNIYTGYPTGIKLLLCSALA